MLHDRLGPCGMHLWTHMRVGLCSDGGLVLTKGAIREGCRRGALAYDYVDLGSEEIAQKVRI